MSTRLLLIYAIATVFASCQQNNEESFEGKVIYKNSYKSKISNVSDEQFTSMVGSRQEYFIKGGNYKSLSNGSSFEWQLFINKDNKLYTKLNNSRSPISQDVAINTDSVLKTELNEGVQTILGYKCDELILHCKSGIQKFYFNSELSIDPKSFANHKFANWYEYLSRAKSLPLKSIIENQQFILESVAIEIKPMKLEEELFELPSF
jgi:hypothetical protein